MNRTTETGCGDNGVDIVEWNYYSGRLYQ